MQQGWKIDSSSSNFLVPPSRSVIIIINVSALARGGKASTATAGDNVIWLGYGGLPTPTPLEPLRSPPV